MRVYLRYELQRRSGPDKEIKLVQEHARRLNEREPSLVCSQFLSLAQFSLVNPHTRANEQFPEG